MHVYISYRNNPALDLKEIEILVWDFITDHRGVLVDFPVIP